VIDNLLNAKEQLSPHPLLPPPDLDYLHGLLVGETSCVGRPFPPLCPGGRATLAPLPPSWDSLV